MSIGFVLAPIRIDWLIFLHTILGTFLTASGTSAFNQYVERDLDRRMLRTQTRPLPQDKIEPVKAVVFSTLLIVAGLFYLTYMVNSLAAMVSVATSIIYLALYTPLKKRSALNLYIGAIPGALPPVGGWAAATGSLDATLPWMLFLIVFFWQVPHVTSIAWLYHEDYQRADFVMLPKNDADGRISAMTSIFFNLLLLPLPFIIWTNGFGTLILLISGSLVGCYYLYSTILFYRDRSKDNARKLLITSIAYLPAVWIVLFVEYLLNPGYLS